MRRHYGRALLCSPRKRSPRRRATLAFELDRIDLDFVLTTGTGSEQRTGVYVRDGSGNFIFFNDYVAHDGRNYGWRYNKSVGDDDDDPSGAASIYQPLMVGNLTIEELTV